MSGNASYGTARYAVRIAGVVVSGRNPVTSHWTQ